MVYLILFNPGCSGKWDSAHGVEFDPLPNQRNFEI